MTEFLQKEQDYLEHYKLLVEEKLNWGKSENWRHHDFETLSNKIFEETDVMLSSTTLKRVWGKLKYNSVPNSNTLNALASYIGFESWMEFRTKVDSDQSEHSTTDQATAKKKTNFKNAPLKWAAISVFLAGFILLALGLQDSKRTFSEAELAGITFTSTPVAEGIPNTVIFKYDLSNIVTDDAMIQQSWDRRLQFEIDPDKHEVTSTYYFPGYFRAKLLVDGVITKENSFVSRNPKPL